ncbi:hypothetical protein SAMN05192569_105319 [Parageobacillus thermantarcticus]|uniref:Uncharacterized protein n=1 Tax=Parageobacillus thermantarcticus TaxID=186116 RepID=A0A1I0TS85_9BACL|nr:hypothetical protein SAMN05192569_105319 [Parageobacillus thermantarcticus]
MSLLASLNIRFGDPSYEIRPKNRRRDNFRHPPHSKIWLFLGELFNGRGSSGKNFFAKSHARGGGRMKAAITRSIFFFEIKDGILP